MKKTIAFAGIGLSITLGFLFLSAARPSWTTTFLGLCPPIPPFATPTIEYVLYCQVEEYKKWREENTIKLTARTMEECDTNMLPYVLSGALDIECSVE